jgi:hypothetical protein
MNAIRHQLSFVQLDQVLHLPALTVDVLVKVLRRAFERGDFGDQIEEILPR